MFWTLAKTSKSDNTINSLRMRNGKQSKTPDETLERAREHFQDLFSPPPPESICKNKPKVGIAGNRKLHRKVREQLTEQFKLKEVQEAIKNLKGGKAAGPDGIPNEFIKAGGKPLAHELRYLFNKILAEEIAPQGLERRKNGDHL